jgi:prepilin-type N-terminal cleavage/methylation domain-containing protein
MKTKFLSRRFSWKRVGFPVLVGALVICMMTVIFVVLTMHGAFSPSNYYPYWSMRRGFTLIELLVVIAILAVLAVVVVLTLNPAGLLQEARDSSRVSDMATLNTGMGLFQADGGTAVGSGERRLRLPPRPNGDLDLGWPVPGAGAPFPPFRIRLPLRRAIFACLGSSLSLTNRTIDITLRKPFSILFTRLSGASAEIERLEPMKLPVNTVEFFAFVKQFPIMSGLCNDVGTSFRIAAEQFFMPSLSLGGMKVV